MQVRIHPLEEHTVACLHSRVLLGNPSPMVTSRVFPEGFVTEKFPTCPLINFIPLDPPPPNPSFFTVKFNLHSKWSKQ